MSSILLVKNLKISIRREEILKDINLNIEKGTVHGLIGVNGAGKTTTFKTLIGYYPRYTGEIVFANDASIDMKISFVPESITFDRTITLKNFLEIVGLASSVEKKELKNRIHKLCTWAGLDDKMNKKPYKFSSGEKKKTLLIQALLKNPDLILLDEPTANLDPISRTQFINLVLELKKLGKTIVIASHILPELESYIDEFTIIHNGKTIISERMNQIQQSSLVDYFDSIMKNIIISERSINDIF